MARVAGVGKGFIYSSVSSPMEMAALLAQFHQRDRHSALGGAMLFIEIMKLQNPDVDWPGLEAKMREYAEEHERNKGRRHA